jgi:Flp pilus assembly protein TadD
MLLGDSFNAMGQPASALQAYLQVISVTPLVARAHGSAGLMLQRLGRVQEAISRYRQALQLDPNLVEVQCNLGTAYQLEQRLEDAVAQYEAAIALKPDLAVAHCNRGTALLDMGDLGGALQSYETAVAIDPNYPEALSNRGATLHKLGLFEQALVSYDQAISVRSDYASAHWNKSITQLLCGDFDAGWPSYEWRWRWDHFPSPRRIFSCPQWTGQTPLNGMTVLVHAEQGLGDTIQFVRYVPLIKAIGASVFLEVPRVLLGLTQGIAGEVQLVATGDPLPDTDFHCPMASLPLAFKTNLDSIPSVIPYIHAEADRAERWARVLEDQGLRVGICWQGKATAKVDQGRSFPLKMLKPLSEIPGVRLISLHKGAGEDQLQDLPPGMTVQSLGPNLDEDGAFLDTAAVMKHCHLVVTSDTAIAHLAGAMGVPVWVALKFVPDWRWMLHRSHSPWYPTMRLFRQSAPGDWGPVFAAMAAELQSALRS